MTPLQQRIRRLSRPLEPLPTGVEPRLPRLANLKAVLFDIYGTLLVSGSGDISLSSGASRADAAPEAFQAVGLQPPADGQRIVDLLHETIRADHAQAPPEVDYPEVDIIEIWRATCDGLAMQGAIETVSRNFDYHALAVEYECRANPVWPMPGLTECLATLRAANVQLGVISNAQFFTQGVFPSLLGQTLEQLGFRTDLCVFSNEHRRAKPGLFLYEEMRRRLAASDLRPGDALYVGNDMLNDIWAASQVGFRTALFAGDRRSLRLREDDARVEGLSPDAILTDLRQTPAILSNT